MQPKALFFVCPDWLHLSLSHELQVMCTVMGKCSVLIIFCILHTQIEADV